jgi:hypothetical protein
VTRQAGLSLNAVVESACHTKIVSSVAACPVYSVVLSPDRALVQYEVLSATVQSAVLQNERVPIAATPNAMVQILGLRSVMAQTVVIPNETAQTVVTPNETAQTSGFRNATVQTVLVQSVGIRHGMVVRWYRAVMVLMVAHCAAPPSVAVVHCVAQAPRYVAVGARCGELQLWQAEHYAEEVHSSESEPRFAAAVELVQCVRELALASHLRLNSQGVRHDLASIHLHSKLPALCARAVLRLQLDFEIPCHLDLHRDLSFHAVSAQAW